MNACVSVGNEPLVMLVFVTPNEPNDEVSLSKEKVEFPDPSSLR